MIREPFAAHLLGAPAFAQGMDHLNPIGVDDPEHGWGGQADLGPVLMGLQKTKEPRPLGEAGKQRPIISRQPAVERTVAHAFERMQDPQGHDLAGPQGSVGMFGYACQRVIDLTE